MYLRVVVPGHRDTEHTKSETELVRLSVTDTAIIAN